MSDRMSDNDLCQCGHNRGYHAPTSNHATAMGEKGCAGCRCTDFKPAATGHGTGSGEAKDWFESMPSLSDVPTPPASPTVTETFAAKEACRIVNKFPQIEQMVMAPMLKMEIALALLRAAEKR